jgi:protein-tyrosine phosphatase
MPRALCLVTVLLVVTLAACGDNWTVPPADCPTGNTDADRGAGVDCGSAVGCGGDVDGGAVGGGDAGSCGDVVDGGGVVDGGCSVGACTPGQRILVGEVLNARDLGGTPLSNREPVATVACGAVYRGAALAGLSGCGCAEVARLGIRTVIDLRTPDERLAAPEASCVAAQAALVQAPMPIPYSVSPADYLADLEATETVAAAFAVLGDLEAYPVYFHCVYGRDRSGVLAAVVLLALGATRDAVMAEYELTAAAGLSTYPASLEAVLDEIDARGGVEAYLAAAGVPAETLAILRARLTVL